MDNRYYFDKSSLQADTVILDKTESSHLLKVRRASVGEEVVGFCGDGYDYHLKVLAICKECKLEVIKRTKNDKEYTHKLAVCLSVLKNDALCEAVENLTALGVSDIILFYSKYTVARIDEYKLIKLRQTAIQACKQSERATIPNITLVKTLNIKDLDGDCFVAYEDAQIESFCIKEHKSIKSYLIIGPEGGFDKTEIEQFKLCGAKIISLGKTILRAPLACVVGATILRGSFKEN